MNNSCQDRVGPRKDSRQDFCKALKTLPSLQHVQLDFLWPTNTMGDIDQRVAMPNLVKLAIYDTFSISLRLLNMNLSVCADDTLFWPTDNTSNISF